MRRFTWYAITASASINAATKDPRSAWVSQSVLLMIARRTRINDRASVATRPSSEFSSASARHRTSSVSRNSKSFSRSSSGKWMEWAIRCDARCDAAPSRLLPAPPILPTGRARRKRAKDIVLRYPGLFFFVSFFSLFLVRDVVGESSRHGRGGSLPWCKTERGSPTIS